ncbi:cyclohexa-1,5-dienecarbonyl-CoA hydratase [Planctomycetaceae bacterium]|nr:cyclohexa-1,5-dienecarbonyl-CoA hydratase [Planctomycetaceae bacterium]
MGAIRTSTEFNGALVRLTVDKPKGNVFTRAVMLELDEAVTKAQADANVKLITLEGAGPHFSFGASVEEHVKAQIPAALAALRKLTLTVAGSKVPVAACVQGVCLGGAFEIVLACHLVFAAPDARFGLPEIKLGVFPPVACALLVKKFGQAITDRLILSGEELTGEQLRNLGLVHHVYPAGELAVEVQAWFKRTLNGYSASSLRHATQAAREPLMKCLEERLVAHEKAYVESLMATHDANEGIAAFIEKRNPTWRNA